MDINRENLEVLFQDFCVAFTNGFNSGRETTIRDSVAMEVPSTSSSVLHSWLNQIPKIREWLGDRVVNNIESNSFTIANRKFESTIEIPREDIEDDQHGLYRPLATLMGQNAAVHPDELLVDTMVANANWGGDDAAFFSDARTYGANTIDNLSGTALDASEFETAYANMTSYLGHNSEPLAVIPKFLVFGPSNRTTAFDILENDFRATAASDGVAVMNRNRGLVQPIQSARLVGANSAKWFLLGEQAGLRAPVLQKRKDPEFQASRFRDDSDYVFETDKYQMGTRARYAAFLSLPHLAYFGDA